MGRLLTLTCSSQVKELIITCFTVAGAFGFSCYSVLFQVMSLSSNFIITWISHMMLNNCDVGLSCLVSRFRETTLRALLISDLRMELDT